MWACISFVGGQIINGEKESTLSDERLCGTKGSSLPAVEWTPGRALWLRKMDGSFGQILG